MKYIKNYKIFEKNQTSLSFSDWGYRELPELPPNMTHLFCSHNKLRVLPELPKTLKRLDCDNNELIELPTLPPNLKDLNCSYNNLKKLPELPDTLEELTCNYNDWEEPIKTEYVFKFKIMYTPLRRDMFRDENFQRKFLTEHPERFKDLEVNQIGIQPIIKKEFAHLFEGDDRNAAKRKKH